MSTGFDAATTDAFDLEVGSDELRIGSDPVGPGTYHVGVVDVELAPLDKNHQPKKNAYLDLTMEILAGDPAQEIGKKFSITFFIPDRSAKGTSDEGWKFTEPMNRLARLGKATCIIPAEVAGQAIKSPPWKEAVGRHFVIRVFRKRSKDPNQLGFLDVGGIWHVASVEVSKFVDAETVQAMPMGSDPMATANANGNGQQAAPKAPATASAPAGGAATGNPVDSL